MNIEEIKTWIDNKDWEKLFQVDDSKRTILYKACFENNIELVKLLLSNEIIIDEIGNKCDIYDQTPLHLVCISNNLKLAKILLSFEKILKESPYKQDKHGATIFYSACVRGNVEIIKLLASYPKILKETGNKPNYDNSTPLHATFSFGLVLLNCKTIYIMVQ